MNKETADELSQRRRARREKIVATLSEKYPSVRFERTRDSVAVVHYKAAFVTRVVVQEQRLDLQHAIPNLDNCFLTEAAAKQAITEQLPLAKQKFEECATALTALQKKLGCEVGYVVEGDTYGLDMDYLYIAFQLNGFDFLFQYEN